MANQIRRKLERKRHLGDKWLKHNALSSDPYLRKHSPATTLFNQKALVRFVRKHPVVFLKPIKGTAGIGVMRIVRKNGIIKLQSGSQTWRVRKIKKLCLLVKRKTRKRAYLIQMGVPLIKINQRPIDFRVVLYRPHNKWLIQGVMGKLAAPQKYVTNHHQGGAPITLQNALKKTFKMSDQQCHQMEMKLLALSKRMGTTLNKHYTNLRELGIDIGIDSKRRPWILEANTRPMYQLFKFHSNKKLYRKIKTIVRKTRLRK